MSDLEVKQDIREPLKRYADLLHGDAEKYIKEGNIFEFDVCKLLLKGTAGAYAVYFAAVSYLKVEPDWSPLALWAVSLLLGLWHLLAWSRGLLRLGLETKQIAGRIYTRLWDSVNGQDIQEQLKNEERKLITARDAGKKPQQKDYELTVIADELHQWRIWAQLGCSVLGIIIAIVQAMKQVVS